MVPSLRYCTRCGAANQAQDTFCFACGQALEVTPASQQYPIAGSATHTSTGLLTPNLLLKQRYRILGTVGKGGFGAVYRAEDVQLGNRLLAVKEMSQSSLNPQEVAEAAENFKREAHILAALKHPNLPSIYEQFSEAGRWYLVMDFIEGETLEEHAKKDPQGHLSVKETLQIGIQLCTVLDYLHSRQPPVIFRDLKPSNIMLTPEGNLYLIDFGIARHFKPGQKRDTIALGSPGYAAPEQYGKAQTTARSDIYSLGATLHHLLTGVDPSDTPFHFAPFQLHGQPTPPGLETLIMQMLEMNETKRPADVIAVKQELQGINVQKTAGKTNIPQPNNLAQPAAPGGSPLQQAQTTTLGAHQQKSSPKDAGNLYLKAKRYQEALTVFEQALQLDPDDTVAYNGKGLAFFELKRYQEALTAFKQAIELDPKFTNAYINKGQALYNLKRYQEALPALVKAIQLDPTKASVYNGKGLVLYELERHEEALFAYEQAIELNPKFTNAYINKGSVLYNLKRYQEALPTFERATQLDPTNAPAYNLKGLVLQELGRYEQAFQAYDRAIQLNPTFSMAFNNKGFALVKLGRYKEALAVLDRAIQLDPKNSKAFNNKGFALEKLRRYMEALEQYKQAEKLDPSDTIFKSNREMLEKRMKTEK